MNLSYENLVNVLTVANGSERLVEQQQAEAQLKNWEGETGYHYTLQDVYQKTELPLQIRWLAVICFKNGIDKYWRSSRPNAIKKEEKKQIKIRLFGLLEEKNNQLTIQNAHATARIVRFDFPAEWPSLFDDISKLCEDYAFNRVNIVGTNNILIMLNQIIKSISMVRIGRSRHAMQSKAPLITSTLIKMYVKYFQEWTTTLDVASMQVCYLCLKNLRRIIPEGFENPHKNQDVSEFLKLSVEHLRGLISGYEKYSSDLLERYVKCYSKLYVGLINTNATSFVLLPCSQDILSTFISLLVERARDVYHSNEDTDFWEILALKGFLLLKKIITYLYRKGAVTLKQKADKEEIKNAINILTQDFFTPVVIQNLCDLIITWYLRLKPSDLESWLLEPEEWCNEELSSSWEFQVRPCSEIFFQDLTTYFKDNLSNFILSKISNGMSKSTSVDTILMKDSVLCTFQLASNSIADNVDFDKLLIDVFIPEAMQNDLVENKILRRRVCLIINEWVMVKCSRESRIAIYRLLAALLQPDDKINDKVVKLTAVQTLKLVVDDWDFDKGDFEPFVNEFIRLSLDLLSSTALTESKLYILNTLVVLLTRCNPLLAHETLSSTLGIIPQYWKSIETEKESILKNSLLRVLKSIVVALNEHSFETYLIAIPLIRACCSADDNSYSLFSEDGYDLWLAILQYFPDAYSQNYDLLSLFDLVHYGLLNSTEILPTILSILRSYALISPSIYSSDTGIEIFKTLASYLPSMRDDAFSIFIAFMDILLLQQTTDETFINALISSGLLVGMFRFVMDDDQPAVSANKILVVLARLAFSSPQGFLQLFDHLAVDLDAYMQRWLDYYNSSGIVRNKKITLLSFLSLLAYGVPHHSNFFHANFGPILKKVFIFLEEINETDNGSCTAYTQDYLYEDLDENSYLDPEIKSHGEKLRYQRLLHQKDPAFNINLKNCLLTTLEQLATSLNHLSPSFDDYTREKLQSFTSS